MKIAHLLSGGVDSGLALALLKEAGHDITAFYLKIWLEDELSYLGSCPWQEDLRYCQELCQRLGVELRVVNLQREYFDTIVSYALSELRVGRTPSPDIFCNQKIKFGAFFSKIDLQEFDKVGTGHYGVISCDDDGIFHLFRAVDPVKDQSYFLSELSQEQLSRLVFPLGNYMKSEVRQMAEERNLPMKSRPDSQGICFLGKIKYSDFVRHYLGEKEGKIIEEGSGAELGTHHGVWFHTTGQRSGLGLSGGPWYVSRKDLEANIVYVVNKETYESRKKKEKQDFIVEELHWIAGAQEQVSQSYDIKLRHGPAIIPGELTLLGGGRGKVHLSRGDRGIAPGQFAIFYTGMETRGVGRVSLEPLSSCS